MDERERLAAIARKHDIALVAIFGSHARGEARPGSDVDLYVRFGRDVGLFEMLGIKHEFEDATGRPVDLIAEELVEPYSFVREGMAKDLAILYEKSEAYGAAE